MQFGQCSGTRVVQGGDNPTVGPLFSPLGLRTSLLDVLFVPASMRDLLPAPRMGLWDGDG